MRYVAAYCLAALSGSEPSAKDIEKILGSVGVDCDASGAKTVVDQLKGKKLEDIFAEGKSKLGTMPCGGGAASGAAAAAAPAPAAAEKKEEKVEEPEEESDEDMGFGLFD